MLRVHAIQTGTVAIKESQRQGHGKGLGRMVNTLTDSHWTEPLPIYAWVIEHPEGVIVVDTGDTARTAEPGYFPSWHPYYRLNVRMSVLPDEEIGPQLRKLGILPTDVRQVVLTHLHTDHAGGLYHFPKSEILVARKEYESARGVLGQIRGFLPMRWPTWFRPQFVDFEPEVIGSFPNSFRLTRAGDVILVPTNGHTPHHLSVIVQDEAISLFLAGDTSYTQQLMIDQVVDGVSPNAKTALQTLKRIREYVQVKPTVYLPSHDPEAAKRLEKRQIVNL
jgi:N-acyl homoserine lactone hydrolase